MMDNGFDSDAYFFFEEESGYEQLHQDFEWTIPSQFNMAGALVDQWAESDRVAVIQETLADERRTLTFKEIYRRSNAVANALEASGIDPGDVVSMHTSQRPEALVVFIGILKAGAIAVPMNTLLGTDGLKYRMNDCESKMAFVDETCIDPMREIAGNLASLESLITLGEVDPRENEMRFDEVIESGGEAYDTAATDADDDALIIYTSGTTGDPKGVVLNHEFLLGMLPFFASSASNMDVREDDIYWSPMGWGWIGSLPSYVLPSLFYGNSIVTHYQERFDVPKTFELIQECEISIVLFPPTSLRMMQSEGVHEDYNLDSLRVILSGGESLGSDIRNWAADAFGDAIIHEVYGQTEMSSPIAEVSALFDHKDGQMGKPVIGHEVAVLDPDTHEEVDAGTVGEIAVRRGPDPLAFDRYLNKSEETAEKNADGWLLMEDLGTYDADGYFSFVGRKDDIIISSGYRISPEEIENTIASHSAVQDAGVISIPDDVRGEVPIAYVVPAPDVDSSDALKEEIQNHVKASLAKHKYPRSINFIDEIPKTSTGKTKRSSLGEPAE